jgi:hypothetical protein
MWRRSEVDLLIENYNLPIQDLIELFPRHTQKSINTKIIQLRRKGKIAYKSEEAKRAAYRKRHDKTE